MGNPNAATVTPRKGHVTHKRQTQIARGERGLCAKCNCRTLDDHSDLCFRHLFFRKLHQGGFRMLLRLSAWDRVRLEGLTVSLGVRYNSIRKGHLRPAGGVDERVLRDDLRRLLQAQGLLTVRDKKPACVWGGARGYTKLLGIVRRLDRRAYRERQRDSERVE